jgi:hypothetical protein
MKLSSKIQIIVFILLIITIAPVQARQIGLIDHSESGLKFSGLYSYSQGDFTPEGGSGDTELINQLAGMRLDWTPKAEIIDRAQFSFMAGKSKIEYGDSETEDGDFYGGGIQYLLESEDTDNPYYLKLVGSFLKHEEQDFEDNRIFEITTDWQAGFLLGKKTEHTDSFGNYEKFHSYFGVVYKERIFEITEAGNNSEFEYENFAGVNAFAGVSYSLNEFMSLEGEAELGASAGGSARLIYYF